MTISYVLNFHLLYVLASLYSRKNMGFYNFIGKLAFHCLHGRLKLIIACNVVSVHLVVFNAETLLPHGNKLQLPHSHIHCCMHNYFVHPAFGVASILYHCFIIHRKNPVFLCTYIFAMSNVRYASII